MIEVNGFEHAPKEPGRGHLVWFGCAYHCFIVVLFTSITVTTAAATSVSVTGTLARTLALALALAPALAVALAVAVALTASPPPPFSQVESRTAAHYKGWKLHRRWIDVKGIDANVMNWISLRYRVPCDVVKVS